MTLLSIIYVTGIPRSDANKRDTGDYLFDHPINFCVKEDGGVMTVGHGSLESDKLIRQRSPPGMTFQL